MADIEKMSEFFDARKDTYDDHHLKKEAKLSLYLKIYNCVRSGGVYIEGDYIVKTAQEEAEFIREYDMIKNERETGDGTHHIDIPLCVNTQLELLKKAGFHNVRIVKEWDKTAILVCHKP